MRTSSTAATPVNANRNGASDDSLAIRAGCCRPGAPELSRDCIVTIRHGALCRILAIGFAAIASFALPLSAQDAQTPDHSEGRRTEAATAGHETPKETTPDPRGVPTRHPSVFLSRPIGSVRIGHQFVDGSPVQERRTKLGAISTLLEIGASSIAFEMAYAEEPAATPAARLRASQQPAGW